VKAPVSQPEQHSSHKTRRRKQQPLELSNTIDTAIANKRRAIMTYSPLHSVRSDSFPRTAQRQ
jgi:hypothetical protein